MQDVNGPDGIRTEELCSCTARLKWLMKLLKSATHCSCPHSVLLKEVMDT